jgi:hypothetical protein
VCVVTCFCIPLPYNQFVSFLEKQKKRKKKKRGHKPEVTLCGRVTQDAQGCAPATTCSPLFLFSFAPYPCSTFALCF